MKRVLLVSYQFPPKGGVGSQRPLKTAKYLPESGWDVTVLTVQDPPTSLLDPGLMSELPDDVDVIRAWSWEPTRVVQALRSLVRRGARPQERSAASGTTKASYSGMPLWAVRLIRALFHPDEKIGWKRFAVREGVKAHERSPFDVIVASGPPFTALAVAKALSRRLDVPWVADLRDPISDNYFFRPPTPLHARLMRSFERGVVTSASRTVVVTPNLARDLSGRHPDIAERLTVITNGFDPADFPAEAPPPQEGFVLSFVGAFQRHAHPGVLLQAIAHVREADPEFGRDVRVRFVGPLDAETTALIDRWGMTDVVDRPGFVSHGEAVLEMCRASVLLQTMDPVPELKVALSGKLPEYLRAGRPILSLSPSDGAAAQVIERSGTGIVVRPGDVDGTVAALETLYEEWRDGRERSPDENVVAEFDRRRLVARYAALLDEVIADA